MQSESGSWTALPMSTGAVWDLEEATLADREHLQLQVRASRGLPLRLMAAEYERILKRRLRIVGGSPDDPALGQLLAVFRQVFT